VWDAADGSELLTLSGHRDSVYSCAWSADGTRIVSGSRDNTLRMWDAASGKCLWQAWLLPEGEVATLDGPPGKYLAVTPGAWRYLAWRQVDPESGAIRVLPAEEFGELATYRAGAAQ
jgi:WD40 repeat protein